MNTEQLTRLIELLLEPEHRAVINRWARGDDRGLLGRAVREFQSVEAAFDELSQRIGGLTAENDQLRHDLAAARRRADELAESYERATGQIAALEAEVAECRDRLENMDARNIECVERNELLSVELAEARNRVEALEGQHEETEARIHDLETDLAVASTRVEERDARHAEDIARVDVLIAERDEIISESSRTLAEARTEHLAALGRLENVLDEPVVVDRVNALEAELSAARAETVAVRTELENNVEVAESRADALQAGLDAISANPLAYEPFLAVHQPVVDALGESQNRVAELEAAIAEGVSGLDSEAITVDGLNTMLSSTLANLETRLTQDAPEGGESVFVVAEFEMNTKLLVEELNGHPMYIVPNRDTLREIDPTSLGSLRMVLRPVPREP